MNKARSLLRNRRVALTMTALLLAAAGYILFAPAGEAMAAGRIPSFLSGPAAGDALMFDPFNYSAYLRPRLGQAGGAPSGPIAPDQVSNLLVASPFAGGPSVNNSLVGAAGPVMVRPPIRVPFRPVLRSPYRPEL